MFIYKIRIYAVDLDLDPKPKMDLEQAVAAIAYYRKIKVPIQFHHEGGQEHVLAYEESLLHWWFDLHNRTNHKIIVEYISRGPRIAKAF